MPRPRTISEDLVMAGTARAIGRLGPARLTLADVAAETGLAPPTLMQRYGSKRRLLLAFATHSALGAGAPFDEATRRNSSPLAALFEALVRMTRSVDTFEELSNHLAFLQIDLNDPEFHRQALLQQKSVRERITDLLRSAIAAGELERCDPVRLARTIHAVWNGTLILWAIERKGRVATWLKRDLEDLIAPFRPPVDSSA